jgi:broad specificity phosphatase PhoE
LSTAKILASPFNLQVQPLHGLIDIDYGRWQGLSLKEAGARDGELYRLWLHSPHLVTFPGGESLEQVRKRVVAALEALLSQHPEQTIVMVSHKVVCKVLICDILGLDNSHFWRVAQDTGAISLVEARDGAFRITVLNDTCHLKNLSGN